MNCANDLSIYEDHADEWWQVDSYYFRSLQNITPFRLALIAEFCGNLKDKKILDLGCGGGLLAVPLIEAGAQVTGIDISRTSIDVAREMSRNRGIFHCGDIRNLALGTELFDLVILADVLDHIREYRQVIRHAARALKMHGLMFAGTINRTIWSRLFAIMAGEGMGFIPQGTHDWRLFITPDELTRAAAAAGLVAMRIQGEWPQFLKSLRNGVVSLRKSRSAALAYSMLFRKVGKECAGD